MKVGRKRENSSRFWDEFMRWHWIQMNWGRIMMKTRGWIFRTLIKDEDRDGISLRRSYLSMRVEN